VTEYGLVERAAAHQAAHADAAQSFYDGLGVVRPRFQKRGRSRLQRFEQYDEAAVYLVFGRQYGRDFAVHVVGPQPSPEVLRREPAMHGVIEMQMGIDEAGHDELVPAVPRFLRGVAPLEIRAFADGDYVGPAQRDRAVAIDPALRIDRDHRSAGEQHIHFISHVSRFPWVANRIALAASLEPVMDFIAHDERAGGAQC
jgi:hypothetical protein